jgi:hypothetical protein
MLIYVIIISALKLKQYLIMQSEPIGIMGFFFFFLS